MALRAFITGGAGFIGSAVVRHLAASGAEVLIIDKMTYAASPKTLEELLALEHCQFRRADICDGAAMASALAAFSPNLVMHLAAESHVDRSIERPASFIETNVVGTQVLLDSVLQFWRGLDDEKKSAFRFHHISTDEVFGSLGASGAFTETTPYDPRSPYSASKAASDHLVRAYGHTYGLPILITNCSNNYGPYHFPEKLIPLNILRGLKGEPMPVYGQGLNVRDWLYVEDHAAALALVAARGRPAETYVIGGRSEMRNIDVVTAIADLLDELAPQAQSHRGLITFVADRPGHDQRYAIDAGKIESELNWRPAVDFAAGLRRTVEWYLARRDWWQPIVDGSYRLERLGLQAAGR